MFPHIRRFFGVGAYSLLKQLVRWVLGHTHVEVHSVLDGV